MLNGIGGKTVAEAKRNLTYQEAHDWFLFAKQRGGISHTDRLLATIATQINRLAGGEAEIGDFLPSLRTPTTERDTPASLGEVMNLIAMVAN